MSEMLDQLEPIAEIIGADSVEASYSGSEIYDVNSGRHVPGWRVDVNGTYRGATMSFSKRARSLDEAAAAAYKQLTEALGLD